MAGLAAEADGSLVLPSRSNLALDSIPDKGWRGLDRVRKSQFGFM